MDIIKKEAILKGADGERLSGYVYIQSYSESPTKNGGSYIGGVLQADGDMQFKAWGKSYAIDKMRMSDMQNKICSIEGYINEYGGVNSVIIEDIAVVEDDEAEKLGLNKVMFYHNKYNVEAYWKTMIGILQKNLSEQAMYIFNIIMETTINDKGETLKDKFLLEYAAINYHDNCVSGLLAHTTKVLNMCKIIKVYPEIQERIGTDLLYLGVALHDIGKVLEYDGGSISNMGMRLSHNILGIMILEKHEEEIVKLKGGDFYSMLVAIISQHHGEYGDRPRTLAAYVINQIDCLDSTLTLLNQTLENGVSEQIKFDGYKLV